MDSHLGTSLKNDQSLPWFDRDVLDGLTQFGPDEQGFTVYLTPEAVEDLKVGTRKNAPNEAFGQLMGRVYKDNNGDVFVVVTGAVYARRLSASIGHVKLNAVQMRDLRLAANRRYPAVDFVGWTHSHHRPSSYSSTDREEQRTWTNEYHIGILTYMIVQAGEPWALAYSGPTSAPLGLRKDGVPLQYLLEEEEPEPQVKEPASQEPVQRGTLPESPTQPAQRFQWIWKWQPVIVDVMAAALILAALYGFLNTNSRLQNLEDDTHSLQATLATHITMTPVSLPGGNLLWNCTPETGAAPLRVECNGAAGPNITSWKWNFGDGSQEEFSSTVSHMYKKPGMFKVKLTVRTQFDTREAGEVVVTVGNA